MFRRSIRRQRRTLLAGLACVATVAMTAGPTVAGAAPAAPESPGAPLALNDSGPFSATADASLLTLDIPAVSPALLPSTSIDLAHSIASTDSDADLVASRDGAQRSVALAGTTGDTSLLGAPISVQETIASAPTNQRFDDVLVPLAAENGSAAVRERGGKEVEIPVG